ncbi:hypothetical protein SKAU_G00099380 [Synaphobranchus kaupii]|uniref:Uncharacterized protein n=1 Tax=Synaphobranchus kaupii TaxID=118154 RepID=A0A9Q1FZ51_SYNKA|nr:hypothetical protein SKAU_G00099380 [Synaphobranchus kaupii]
MATPLALSTRPAGVETQHRVPGHPWRPLKKDAASIKRGAFGSAWVAALLSFPRSPLCLFRQAVFQAPSAPGRPWGVGQ